MIAVYQQNMFKQMPVNQGVPSLAYEANGELEMDGGMKPVKRVDSVSVSSKCNNSLLVNNVQCARYVSCEHEDIGPQFKGEMPWHRLCRMLSAKIARYLR